MMRSLLPVPEVIVGTVPPAQRVPVGHVLMLNAPVLEISSTNRPRFPVVGQPETLKAVTLPVSESLTTSPKLRLIARVPLPVRDLAPRLACGLSSTQPVPLYARRSPVATPIVSTSTRSL